MRVQQLNNRSGVYRRGELIPGRRAARVVAAEAALVSWGSYRTHKTLDGAVSAAGLIVPADWGGLTLAEKRGWLEGSHDGSGL